MRSTPRSIAMMFHTTFVPTKSATKTATPALIPQPNGRGALLTGGVPGNKGGGRTPDAFKVLCQQLACSGAEGVARIMSKPDAEDHPAYLGALKWATEHGYGKPKETQDVNIKAEVEVKGSIQWGKTEVPL